MASAKSMKAGLDAGKSEKKAVTEPKVVPAAKPAAAAPKPTPVVGLEIQRFEKNNRGCGK